MMKSIKSLILLLALVFSYHCFGANKLNTIRTKIRNEYLSTSIDPNVNKWINTMKDNGIWEDIDYSDKSRALWQLEKHLDRIIDMSLYFEKVQHSTSLRKQIVNGLRYYYAGHFHNDNWWYTKIGIPRRMLSLAYILDKDLPQDLHDSILTSIRIIDSNDYPARPGGDRIQVLSNHAKALLWQNDGKASIRLFKKIEKEAEFAVVEDTMYDAAGGAEVRNEWRPAGRGMQADMTFHHRGDRVDCTLTYGQELPSFFCYWADLLKDTPWAFTKQHIQFVVDYYLNSVCRHLVKYRWYEPSAFNRELCRPWEREISNTLTKKLISISNGYRLKDLMHVDDIQTNRVEFSDSWAAYFWQSDYFSFARPNFQTAVRMHSVRNANQEAAHNLEGIKNHFRGDGSCMLSVQGNEYMGLQPVFNFSMIPGTTSPLLSKMPRWQDVQLRHSNTIFSGAVCDSLYGAVGFDFISARYPLTARKSWFFFDEGYVCVGSDINADIPDTLITTIEQCRLSGPVTVDKNWYFHNHNAYIILSGNPVMESEQNRVGTWSNCVLNTEYSSQQAKESVFSLALSHGVRPHKDSYAYAIMPHQDARCPLWFRLVEVSDTIHAVEHDSGNISYVVFFKPGNVSFTFHTIAVDQPCIVMIRNNQVSINDPSRSHSSINVVCDGKKMVAKMPGGNYAGTSISLK